MTTENGRPWSKNGRQAQEIKAYRGYYEENGEPPTQRGLAELVGLNSIPPIARDWGYPKCSYQKAWDRLHAASAIDAQRRKLKTNSKLRQPKVLKEREEGTLGYRLTRLRLENDWTLRDAAEHLRLNPSTVGKYERNKFTPGVDILVKYTEVYDVELDYLVHGN